MQTSRVVRRIISLCSLFILISISLLILGELLRPAYNMYSTYFLHDLDTIESECEQVDLVFIGASGEYHAYVPEVFEKELNMNCVINAGSSAQPVSASYYQLKELIKRFHPKNVVIGLAWNRLAMFSLQGKLIVYDRLTGLTRFQYGMNCFQTDERIYTLYAYRYRENIDKIKKIYNSKQNLIMSDYEPQLDNNEYYADTGFVYSYDSIENGNVSMEWWGKLKFTVKEKVKEENLKYLDACVKLCEDNDINLYLISSPRSMSMIYSIENYQEAVDFYFNYAEKNGLIYHNLNFLKNRESIIPDSMMRDDSHLNGRGAYIISKVYAKILEKDMAGIDTCDYFYKNLNELEADIHRVVSVDADIIIENSNAHIETKSLHNDNVIPYYQILFSEDKEHYDVFVDWTRETKFDIDISGKKDFNVKIKAKTGNKSNKEVEAFQIYNYEEIIDSGS
nr:hypothetical protein [uncultured Schaedlerella sp.]